MEVLQKIVGDDVIVRIEASHSCMTARGIKKPGAKTVTISKKGLFDSFLYTQEFLKLVKD